MFTFFIFAGAFLTLYFFLSIVHTTFFFFFFFEALLTINIRDGIVYILQLGKETLFIFRGGQYHFMLHFLWVFTLHFFLLSLFTTYIFGVGGLRSIAYILTFWFIVHIPLFFFFLRALFTFYTWIWCKIKSLFYID